MDFAQQQDARDARDEASEQQPQFNPTAWLEGLPGAVLTQQFAMDCPDAELNWWILDSYEARFSTGIHVFQSWNGGHYVVDIPCSAILLNSISADEAHAIANEITQAARLCERFSRANGRIPAIPAHVERVSLSEPYSHFYAHGEHLQAIDANDDPAFYAAIRAEIDTDWEPIYPQLHNIYRRKETTS